MTDPVINSLYTPTWKDKAVNWLIDKIPSPVGYLKNVVREDTPERVAAFLAVLAGVALVVGFLGIVFAIVVLGKSLIYELGIVCGALVTLATFSKVDRDTPIPPPKEHDHDRDGDTQKVIQG